MPRITLPQVESSTPAGAIAEQLQQRIEGEVRFGRHDRLLYATDASLYQVEPIGVVVPRSAADLVATIEFCRDHDLPVLARGGGSSLAGQTVNRAVVIDCSAWMTGVIDIDAAGRTVTLEPGLVLDELRAALAGTDLDFGPEVSSSAQATIGGMIANCSAGLHSLVHGMTDEHVISLDVVLPDGRTLHLAEGSSEQDPAVADLTHQVAEVVVELAAEIDARFPAVRRNVGGYALDRVLAQVRASTRGTYDKVNLAQLVCGSEGTLALVTQATMRLVDRPGCTGLAVLGFDDVHSSLECISGILETGPSAVELLDSTIIDAACSHEVYGDLLDLLPVGGDGTPGTILYVDYFTEDASSLEDRFAALRRVAPAASVAHYVDSDSQEKLWYLRKVSLGLIQGGHGPLKPVGMLEDCAVPPDRLCEFQVDFDAMLQRHGLDATWYAHASVGLLHIRPRMNLQEPAQRDELQAIGLEAVELVRRYGGSVSGEHGDGRIRREMVNAFYGPKLVEGFKRIKAIFDPDGRFNPGVITGEPTPMQDLRLEPGGRVLPREIENTFFNWQEHGGLVAASEACNGNGLCRRSSGGAMCPSYRATRDERHATRGRGNALRLAITGQPGGDDAPCWDDPATLETLDLCLGCKACRYECPSQVDVAKLKAEYEAQRYRQRGRIPLRVRLVGHVRRINRLGSAAAPLANLVQKLPPFSWCIRGIMGVSPGRTLPRFSRSIRSWMRARPVDPDAPVVLLLPDCFCTWGETGIARSATKLLEAFGYRVVLPDMGCCGRTMCSTGMLEAAQRTIERSAGQLHEAIEAHAAVAVVGVEPSCVSALQQEWLELRTGVDPAVMGRVASLASTVEQFIVDAWDQHPRRPSFEPTDEALLLHVHCHQKHRAEQVAEFLRSCGRPGVELLDSGCCGMAGSFGYAREHHAISVKIAEQSLGDPLRGAPYAAVSANGTSCRHQVHDVFDRSAEHPVVLAEARLTSNQGEMT